MIVFRSENYLRPVDYYCEYNKLLYLISYYDYYCKYKSVRKERSKLWSLRLSVTIGRLDSSYTTYVGCHTYTKMTINRNQSMRINPVST